MFSPGSPRGLTINLRLIHTYPWYLSWFLSWCVTSGCVGFPPTTCSAPTLLFMMWKILLQPVAMVVTPLLLLPEQILSLNHPLVPIYSLQVKSTIGLVLMLPPCLCATSLGLRHPFGFWMKLDLVSLCQPLLSPPHPHPRLVLTPISPSLPCHPLPESL